MLASLHCHEVQRGLACSYRRGQFFPWVIDTFLAAHTLSINPLALVHI